MNQPIGCRAFHFPKKKVDYWICMYCGILTEPEFKTIKYAGYTFTFRPLKGWS